MDTPVYILDASFILLRLSHALPPFRNYLLFDDATLTCSFAFRIDFLFLYSCLSLHCYLLLSFTCCRRVICESESGQENSVRNATLASSPFTLSLQPRSKSSACYLRVSQLCLLRICSVPSRPKWPHSPPPLLPLQSTS